MPRTSTCHVLAAAGLLLAPPAVAQDVALVNLDFPTSAEPEAHAAFIRGLGALYNFWYPEAVASFRRAQRLEPDFALAYWGEALAHDEVWAEEEAAAGRAILAKLAPTPELRREKAPTERERAYLESVEALFAADDYRRRNLAYVEAMDRLSRRYPDDLEAKALLAEAILRTLDPWNIMEEETMLRAGQVAEEVLARNPQHPGALHYLIHAYDTPEHAPRALEAANRYGQVAGGAPHAVHMPSHIYLQLGRWDDVVTTNLRAFEVSERTAAAAGRPLSGSDYHALEFLSYAYLQQGRRAEALAVWTRLREAFEGTEEWSWVGRWYYARLAFHILETGRKNLVSTPLTAAADIPAVWYALGALAVSAGDRPGGEKWLARLARDAGERAEGSAAWIRRRIEIEELTALSAVAEADTTTALRAAAAALALHEQLGPQSELPNPIQPVHELQGEVLLWVGRADEAARAFDRALQLTPNRPAALLGRARAAMALADSTTALRAYECLLFVRAEADEGLPDVAEAKRFLKTDRPGVRQDLACASSQREVERAPLSRRHP